MALRDSSTTIAVHSDVVWRDVDGEIVVLNVVTGHYFGLDGVASHLWQLVQTPGASIGTIGDALGRDYDIDRPTIDRDVSSFIDDLLEHHLIAVGL